MQNCPDITIINSFFGPLVFLLSLSHSDKAKHEEEGLEDEDDDEGIQIYEINQKGSEVTNALRKAAEIRALLAEGEEPCRHFSSSGDSDLSDWSEDEQLSSRRRENQPLLLMLGLLND